jgi:proteasome assembly chaperone (PAC2) family protein
MAMRNWRLRRTPDSPPREGKGPVLIHALDGFLGAGSASRLAADQLRTGKGEVIHEFDLDEMFDYRARRPMIAFRENHYADYDDPTLQVVLEHDANGEPYFLLAGPEPDFQWERFVGDVHDIIEEHDVPLTLGLGAVPMGVPHTRPAMITAHGTRTELVDRQNLWSAQVTVPSSAQSLLEYRLGQWGHDAAGYVVHVPHYLAQIDYPPAALALLDALVDRTGLSIDASRLRARQEDALKEIEQQIEEQGGAGLLGGLEEQHHG